MGGSGGQREGTVSQASVAGKRAAALPAPRVHRGPQARPTVQKVVGQKRPVREVGLLLERFAVNGVCAGVGMGGGRAKSEERRRRQQPQQLRVPAKLNRPPLTLVDLVQLHLDRQLALLLGAWLREGLHACAKRGRGRGRGRQQHGARAGRGQVGNRAGRPLEPARLPRRRPPATGCPAPPTHVAREVHLGHDAGHKLLHTRGHTSGLEWMRIWRADPATREAGWARGAGGPARMHAWPILLSLLALSPVVGAW